MFCPVLGIFYFKGIWKGWWWVMREVELRVAISALCSVISIGSIISLPFATLHLLLTHCFCTLVHLISSVILLLIKGFKSQVFLLGEEHHRSRAKLSQQVIKMIGEIILALNVCYNYGEPFLVSQIIPIV